MTQTQSESIWQKGANGKFHRFLMLDPEEEGLEKVGGVFVLWHAGTQPEWVFVGHSANLARTFHELAADRDITLYNNRGGLYVTWGLIRDEFRAGVVRYLTEELHPVVENERAPGREVKPIPVGFPGAKGA